MKISIFSISGIPSTLKFKIKYRSYMYTDLNCWRHYYKTPPELNVPIIGSHILIRITPNMYTYDII